MGGMAEEKKGASALSSSSSRSATSHSDDKTEAKSATRHTSSGKQSTSRTTSTRKRTTAKTPRASRTTKAATAAAVANGEVPAQSIPVADPSQFGRIAVMDVTPNEESGRFPARVELGEPFKVTAQVFIEGRTKVGATAIVRNHRGKEMQRLPMTCTNPGLDRWEVMLTCGEHSDVKPWQPEFAAIKRQLGEWSVTIEGWEDTYKSWLHDAAIKVKVNDDVENALESGAQLLERWAKTRRRQAERRAAKDARRRCRHHEGHIAYARGPSRRGDQRTGRPAASDQPAARRRLAQPAPAFPRAASGIQLRRMVPVLPAFRGRLRRPGDRQDRPGHAQDVGVRPGTRQGRRLRHRVPAADLPDRQDEPQGTQQRAGGRSRRSGLAVRHRFRAGRARHRRPAARQHGRFQGARRQGPRAGSGNRARLRAAVLARPPVGQAAPGLVPPQAGRLHRLRGEPAEEVSGHLPDRLQRRHARHREGSRTCSRTVDQRRRDDLPHRQPPHQAGALLAGRHRGGHQEAPGDPVPGRGVHPPGHDARAELRLDSRSRTATSRGATPRRSWASTWRPRTATTATTSTTRSGPPRRTSSPPTCATTASPATLCARCSPRWAARAGASTTASS